MGLLIDGLVLLVYLLLGLLIYGLVLLVYRLLGRLVYGRLASGPTFCLAWSACSWISWFGLLFLLVGLLLDLLFRLLLLLVGLGLDLLFRLLLRLLCLLLDLLRRFGLLFGDLLLRGFLLLVAELVQIRLVVVGRLAEAHGYEHGTVRARAEPFGHRVVGLARLGGLGQGPVVGLAEVEVADGQWRGRMSTTKPDHQRGPGVGADEGGPAGPAVGPLVVVDAHAGHAQAVDPGPDQAEDRGEQRGRRRGRDEHHYSRRVAERRHEWVSPRPRGRAAR